MNADIVERLRYIQHERGWQQWVGEFAGEAADEIERLRAENERLRRAVTLNARFDTPLGGVS